MGMRQRAPVEAGASGGHPLKYPSVPLRNEAGPRYVLRDHRPTLSRQRVFGVRGLRDILRDRRRDLYAAYGPIDGNLKVGADPNS